MNKITAIIKNTGPIFPLLTFTFIYLLNRDIFSLIFLVLSFIYLAAMLSVNDYYSRFIQRKKIKTIEKAANEMLKRDSVIFMVFFNLFLRSVSLLVLMGFLNMIEGLFLFLIGISSFIYEWITAILEKDARRITTKRLRKRIKFLKKRKKPF